MPDNIMVMFSPMVMGIIASLCVLILMTRGRKVMIWMCAVFFLLSFIGGLALYTIGYMPCDAGLQDAPQAMLRGLFSTGRMFFINDDYAFLLESSDASWLTGNNALLTFFWLCHVLSLVFSIAALTAIFGRRAIDFMRMKRFYDTCYIILGVDWRAVMLGKHIALHDKKRKRPDRKRLIVYIYEDIKDEFRSEIAEFGGIALETGEYSFTAQIIRAGFAAKIRVKHVKIIVMPDDEIRVPGLLLKAMKCAKERKLDTKRFEYYLLAESEWIYNRAWELASKYGCMLHAMGEAELAARKMIVSLPPWSKTVIQNGLTALILGFNQTGQEALRRLIMNGQFPDTRMRAIVVDKNIEAIKDRFMRCNPCINKCCETLFHSCDINSEAFYKLLDERGAELNYIVTAMGSDALNLNTAQSLREYFERKEMVQPPTIVFLRSACPEADDESEKEVKTTVFISRSEHLFTEAFIIHEELDRMAMEVNAVYREIPEGNHGQILSKWRACTPFIMESNRAAADFIDGILAIVETHTGKPFDPYHTDESMREMLAKAEHYRWYAFHCASGWSPMSMEKMESRFNKMLQNKEKNIDSCRKCETLKQHVCMVEWEKLGGVSDKFNELMEKGGIPEKEDFKKYVIYNEENISRFLKIREMITKGGKSK